MDPYRVLLNLKNIWYSLYIEIKISSFCTFKCIFVKKFNKLVQESNIKKGGVVRMLESGGGAPGGEGARLGAPHPTSLEERKSPLSAQITMQVSLEY